MRVECPAKNRVSPRKALHVGEQSFFHLPLGRWCSPFPAAWTSIVATDSEHHIRSAQNGSGGFTPSIANVAKDREFRLGCQGRARVVRYADDFLVLFEAEEDATRFAAVLPERLAKFGLEVAPEKTRLVPFGRQHWRQEKDVAGSFDFLGFSHYLGTNRKGAMVVVRQPAKKGVHRFLMEVKEWLRRNMHLPPEEQRRTLAAKLRGYFQYFGLSRCSPVLKKVHSQVLWYWARSLRRRSQRGRRTWEQLRRKAWYVLPTPRVVHPQV